jgi:translation initiation factor 3 subunit A
LLRVFDERTRLQRQKEEEAEAKIAAKKAGRFGADRPISRDVPAEPSSSTPAPPRIALPGGKMTWREREAMKAAGQTPPPAAGAPSAAAPAEASSPAAEPEAPKRSGYVPPALRAAGGAAPGGGWREREGSGRGPPARTESPATGGRYEAPARGGRSFGGDDRKASPATGGGYVPPSRRGADGPPAREAERESAPPPAQGASDGKYRPGAFKRTGA